MNFKQGPLGLRSPFVKQLLGRLTVKICSLRIKHTHLGSCSVMNQSLHLSVSLIVSQVKLTASISRMQKNYSLYPSQLGCLGSSVSRALA